MAIEIEQKAIESNSNPTLNHLMLCSSEIEANTLTLASLGISFWSPFGTFSRNWSPFGTRTAKSIAKFTHKSKKMIRNGLPIASHRSAIESSVRSHKTTILVGETGSGKHFSQNEVIYDI